MGSAVRHATTKRRLLFAHIIHAAGGQSNSALSLNFMGLEYAAPATKPISEMWIRLCVIWQTNQRAVLTFNEFVTSRYPRCDHKLSASRPVTLRM
jgi:hypothetical protein